MCGLRPHSYENALQLNLSVRLQPSFTRCTQMWRVGSILRGSVSVFSVVPRFLIGMVMVGSPAYSQQSRVAATATLVGVVRRDSIGNALPGARVYLPALKVGAVANYLGEFRLMQLPPGNYGVEVSYIGFAPLRDTVELTADRQTLREFILAPRPVELDSVKVIEPAATLISPMLRGFEMRRRMGLGYFVSADELRRNEERDFSQVLRERIPALRIVTEKSAVWAASARNGVDLVGKDRQTRGGSASQVMPRTPACWVSVFLDGVRIYDRVATPFLPPPDLTKFLTREFAGVEFYPGGATVPPEYNQTAGGCGVLLLWTRER